MVPSGGILLVLGAEDPSGLDRRFAQPRMLFFGIGAQKSGTTWIHKFLAGHPEIHMPLRQKELHYWTKWRAPYLDTGKDILEHQRPTGQADSLIRAFFKPGGMKARRRRIEKGAFLEFWERSLTSESPGHSAYADVLFHGYRGQPVVGEITPSYAMLENTAFADMAVIAPDVRFIFVMRDPVDRLHAGVRHKLRREHGSEGLTNAEVAKAMNAALADRAGSDYLRSRYDLTIRALESEVPRDRIAYFFFETLFSQSEADRLCAFLGVSSQSAPIDQRVNIGKDRVKEIEYHIAQDTVVALAPVYKFCAERFGELPSAWRYKPAITFD